MQGTRRLLMIVGARALIHAAALEAVEAVAGVDGVCASQGGEVQAGANGHKSLAHSSDTSTEEAEVSITSVCIDVACFCAAFAVIRLASKTRSGKGISLRRADKKLSETAPETATTLQAWRSHRRTGPIRGQELHHWAGRVLATEPEAFVEEFIGHLAQQNPASDHTPLRDEVSILMEVAAKAGQPEIVEAVTQAARERMGVHVDPVRLHHCLLSAHASCGSERRVEQLLAQERAEAPDGAVAVRSLAAVVRGYLKVGKLPGAVAKLQEMRRSGREVPARAVSELFAAAARTGAVKDTYESLGGQFELPADAVAMLLEFAFQSEDFEFARAVEQLAKDQNTTLTQEAFASMLKLHVKVDDGKAIEVFQSMQSAGFLPCEGLCRYIIARCADSQNVRLAECAAEYLRSRHEMSLSCYKTLMKVYAYSGRFGKACDLYDEIKQRGLEPDAVMYGSLVKCATKAGRTDLSHELADKVQGGCIRNYMWLIRSAGQEGDVKRAVDTFRKLQSTSPELVDVMAYNVTIDACASNKDMVLAQQLLEEMRENFPMNIITYNTIMKGQCVVGDLDGARQTLREMEKFGIAPDAASFSCLLSRAAKQLDYKETLRIIAELDSRKLPLDSYVVSIMMQLSRKLPDARDGYKALSILDRPDVQIFEDEIVFNTVLDACIYRRDYKRLSMVVERYPDSKVRASVRTYGLLIKACAVLQTTKGCWRFWNEMIDRRGITPNDVTLGCMIDALVEAQQIDDALALFQDWKTQVPCDTIVYSTLIKGFASIGDADRAMALFQDMRTSGVQLNHIVFTALINAHAKNGLMKRAEQLMEEMEKEGCKPNSITYSSLIRGHCVRGDLSAALSVFHQMVGYGFRADAVIFNTLLDGCTQHGNFELADELLLEMGKSQVAPSNYTLSIMVKMWSKRGKLDKAFEVVRAALKDPTGPKVDAQVGACIVGACIHNRTPQRALAIFQEMKEWPNFNGPDNNTYSALISGLPRHGYVLKAVELAEEACVRLNTKPGQDKRLIAPTALMQLFRALRNERLLHEVGHDLAAKLRKAGMHVEDKWLAQ